MTMSSPQLSQQRDMTAEGETYIVGQGPPLAAGSDVTFAFTGLPHAPTWPRNVALALAVVILLAGAFAAVQRPPGAGRDGRAAAARSRARTAVRAS